MNMRCKRIWWTMALAMGFPLFSGIPLFAQVLSLKEARQMAHNNYPAIKQYQMIEQSKDYSLENAAKGWLPQVSASAGAYAFTDIIQMNELLQQVGLDMENYMANASVTIRQKVYDGGQIAANKLVASAQSEVQRRQLDVSLYAINERIDQLYFGVLLLDEQLAQNDLLQKDLANSEQTIRSMMKGGVANQSDLDAILVEKVKAEQQQEVLQTSRKAYLGMLGVFIGKELGGSGSSEKESVKLEKPEVDLNNSDNLVAKRIVNRPELSFYASQNLLLDAQRKQLDTKLRPTVSLFGLGMVHSKMGDMAHNGMLAAGVSLSWNIGALYTRKNDIRKLEVQRQLNDSQRETFLFNNRLQNEEADGNIASLQKQIEKDEEIVRLRESIRSKSDRKVQLGTESVNELVRDIHAVSLARAQKAQHEIQLLKEIYKQKNINNF